MIFPVVADAAPVIEAIGPGRIRHLVTEGRPSGKAHLVILFYFYGPALASGLALAMPNRDQRGIAIGVDIEAVLARFGDGEGHVWSVNFVDLAVVEMTN